MHGAPAHRSLGDELRRLRLARQLSVSETARRTGVPRPTLQNWEAGRARPTGYALERLLRTLETDDRTLARLLVAVDPRHARVALAHTPFGTTVDVGMVLRAMRIRRGSTQADLARAVGVAQGTVAKWEGGNSVPDAATIHLIGLVLGAAVEETVALSCANGDQANVPSDREEAERFLQLSLQGKGALFEAIALGFEAEIWRRALRQRRWDEAQAYLSGSRAEFYFQQGRFAEVDAAAQRGIRVAATPRARAQATRGVAAMVSVAQRRDAPIHTLDQRIERWIQRIPDSSMKAWMMSDRALCLAEQGQGDAAVEMAERSSEILAKHRPSQISLASVEHGRMETMGEVYLRLGLPDRAAEAWNLVPDAPESIMAYVRIRHASGRPGDEEHLESIRRHVADPAHDNWINRDRLARLERDQARLSVSGDR